MPQAVKVCQGHLVFLKLLIICLYVIPSQLCYVQYLKFDAVNQILPDFDFVVAVFLEYILFKIM